MEVLYLPKLSMDPVTNSPIPSESGRRVLDPEPFSAPGELDQLLSPIFASQPFRNSQQCQRLLRYIVEHSLAHQEHLLRERVIGCEVFGRPADYEPGEDPVVRVRAAEVRKRLAQYYQSRNNTPESAEVQIDIPPGSYRAAFRWKQEAQGAPPVPSQASAKQAAPPETLPKPVAEEGIDFVGGVFAPGKPTPATRVVPGMSRSRLWFLVLGLGAALALAGACWRWASGDARSFHAFWQPWISANKPVVISIGSNAVYRLSNNLTEKYAKEHHLEAQGVDFFVPIPPEEKLNGSDLVMAENSFVALGDVSAVSSVVATLTAAHQVYQERFPNDISFAELRNTATILVGGFNNPMTVELTKGLPFVLRARNEIDDTSSGRTWLLHASDDSHDTEDYAIVTRLVRRNGDEPILIVAGMGQYGTLAGANFICSRAAMSGLTKQLPSHWADHNLQFVLHVRVVDFKAYSVDVIAKRIW